MTDKIAIITCSNLAREFNAIINHENWEDVALKVFACNCFQKFHGRSNDIAQKLMVISEEFAYVESFCPAMTSDSKNARINYNSACPCYSLLMNKSVTDEYARNGRYILTPCWLKNWKFYVIKTWGFDAPTAREFFKDSEIRRALLLDTGIFENISADFKEFCDYTGLEPEIIKTGLDHLRLNIENALIKRRFEIKENEIKILASNKSREHSQYIMSFDLLKNLAALTKEDDVIEGAIEMFSMLFAPKRMAYFALKDGEIRKIECRPSRELEPDEIEFYTQDFDGAYKMSESETGFGLKLVNLGETVGIIWLEDMAFGQYIQKYLNMALNVIDVCALAIANARKYFELDESRMKLTEEKKVSETANKMKSVFLATMSHEIRTPITAIQGYSELLAEMGLTPDQLEMANFINVGAQTLSALVNDILDFSKIEANMTVIERTEFNMLKVIDEIMVVMSPAAAKKSLNFYKTIDEGHDYNFMGDPHRLRQIILNLTSNAVKFTSEGDVELKARILSETENESLIEISVRDEGIGIGDDALERIFSPFSQADGSITRKYGGTGLGLSIANNLVRLMGGGKINVESKIGSGSRFYFSINFAKFKENLKIQPPSKEEAEKEPAEVAAQSALPRILIVEDNPINRMMVKKMLERHGCDSAEAADGQAAIDILAGGKFDAVLMDLQMPGMDGVETTKLIRKSGDQTPIVALTAALEEGNREACIAAGMNDFLPKPISARNLGDMIARIVARDVK